MQGSNFNFCNSWCVFLKLILQSQYFERLIQRKW